MLVDFFAGGVKSVALVLSIIKKFLERPSLVIQRQMIVVASNARLPAMAPSDCRLAKVLGLSFT